MACSDCGALLSAAAVFVAATLVIGSSEAWQQSQSAKSSLRYGAFNADQIFNGNKSTKNYFKILLQDQNTALIGSRNVLYNVSLDTMRENHRYYWSSSEANYQMCQLKGKSEDDCQNYIRVAFKKNNEELFVCGTNAFHPMCKVYNLTDGTNGQEVDGRGRCPYDPLHNSTAIYTGGQLYSGTVADFSGSDPLIYKDPMRTERLDFKQLNDPNFVSSLEYKDYVFFFFREIAVEYINCGKAIYSRVARVCKNDKGGPHSYRDRWTSFLKARLNCSIPGEYPFYFDEIQSTSDILNTALTGITDPIVYGVFNTPVNSISGSAVCMFNISDVIETFMGSFKDQEAMDANWLPVKKVPEPRPGMCVEDSRTLPDVTVNFVKSHSLMDSAVPSLFSMPIFTRISQQSRLTSIVVDNQVAGLKGQHYDILFMGTDDGRLIKGSLHTNKGSPEFIPVEEVILIPNSPVRSLNLIKSTSNKSGRIVATFDQDVVSIPLERCNLKTSCQECIELQDPYCAWDGSHCVNQLEPQNSLPGTLIQSIGSNIDSAICPKDISDLRSLPALSDDTSNNIDSNLARCPSCEPCSTENVINKVVTNDIPVVALGDVIGLIMMMVVLATLVIGFAVGYMCSRHFRHTDPFSAMAVHTHHQLNRLADMNASAEIGNAPFLPCANNKAPLNLLVNVTKSKNDTLEKNLDASIENKTLQKVKKTYI
ncbi:semaphorin-1A-like [Daktulosphaira vitifoliae]|uniref:semaphorin-1A-like n=1 Tax=Daktulosphaira vitifoliae TaxID=58002 RepID=UPI0021AAC7C5|nr:semaphorin-1A-like [Daktulosphaira vitifoliae]XP_050541172.1 semaphorin-1A-like [Daktulosphaira vitifoliae]XP_050541173.1 semaphorin-1A-like [Daktulosphaira vitifoliae]